jgi:CPA2 family monovalent cation:H+ antiporter-2
MNGDFLSQSLVYLGTALVCVPIARRLGFSSVLGYIFAGAIIGPYAFGWIGQRGEDIMHIAEFGVVMMLFLIGLELEPAQFWRMRRSIVGLGSIQFLGTTLVLTIIGALSYQSLPQSLAVGMALSMSSTAIVLQTLKEKGISQTAAGRASFAVLLFQDIAVIPVLALLPLLAAQDIQGEAAAHPSAIHNLPQWLQALVIVGAIAGVYAAGRYLVVPLLRLIAKTHLRELFIAASLFLVIAVAEVMVLIGLSPALGAFLAGVVLANSEFRHELETDILPFKSLLLGLFFIGVGSSVNFDLIWNAPLLIGALLVGTLLVKLGVLYISGAIFKLKTDQNLLYSFGLGQVGEFAFVLLNFAGALQIVDRYWLDNLMAVTALSMAATPFLLLINERLIAPFVGTKETVQKEELEDIEEKHEVLIAGFGHFGSTVARFLRANGVEANILDYDSDRVDLLRKLGFNVYYGDATRADLLRTAGAEEAKILVAAIDSPEVNARLIETAGRHFPHLKVLARAKNRFDAYEMIEHGVENIYRETLYTSVHLAVDVLKALGHRAFTATRQAQKFIRYDEEALRKLAKQRHDMRRYVTSVRQEIESQEQLLLSDLQTFMETDDSAWDGATLRESILSDIEEQKNDAHKKSTPH